MKVLKIFIVGNGAFGSANAIFLGHAGHDVTLCFPSNLEHDMELMERLQNGVIRDNYLYLPGFEFPPNVSFTDSWSGVSWADIILIAVPCYVWTEKDSAWVEQSPLMDAALEMRYLLKHNLKATVALLSKGFNKDYLTPWGVFLERYFRASSGFKNFAVISGPTFAKNLADPNKIHIASVASRNISAIKKLKEMVHGTTWQLEGTIDLIGVSMGGGLKNAYTIGYGIAEKLGYAKDLLNTYLRMPLREMKLFLDFAGARRETLFSPAISGDFYMTAKGESRNRAFGRFLAEFHSKDEIEKELRKSTVEGYESMRTLWQIANKNNLNVPLLYSVHSISEYGASPDAFREVFERARALSSLSR